jgi:organic radical activating enzyme
MNTVKTPQYTLKISEIFYSLQGEGYRAGHPSIFIRLQGCSAQNACYKSGVRCDTEFTSGKEWLLNDLHKYISQYNCKWIVWTGGEPTDQLNQEILDYYKHLGYKNAIECSGIKQPPLCDWVVLSPKVAEHVILKKWNVLDGDIHCNELRWVRHKGQEIPQTKIQSENYYISPHFDGQNINNENLEHCIQMCLDNPLWKLSVQQHKLWSIL